MSTLSKLRRLVLRQDVSVREASRRLGISRNTATKWLKDGQMVEPRYPQRVSAPSILDPYKEQLSQWLKADSHRSKRDRRGIKAMFEALRAQGYSGSRGPVYAFAQRWQQEQGNAELKSQMKQKLEQRVTTLRAQLELLINAISDKDDEERLQLDTFLSQLQKTNGCAERLQGTLEQESAM